MITEREKWKAINRDITSAGRCEKCGAIMGAYVVITTGDMVCGRYYTRENAEKRRKETRGSIITEKFKHC